jgi:hypothetical protein
MNYTPEFWKRAQELADANVHECGRCGVRRGAALYRGAKLIGYAHVRLVLFDGDKANLKPENIAMGCLACFPDSATNTRRGPKVPAEQTAIPK